MVEKLVYSLGFFQPINAHDWSAHHNSKHQLVCSAEVVHDDYIKVIILCHTFDGWIMIL